jgi:HEPN domain-containing protein
MRKEIENWTLQAKDDLEKAEILQKNKKYDGSAFYCQQAVEKYLKAPYIRKLSKSPGQTHSLVYLAKGIGVPKEFYSLLQSLTPEFVITRYPDIVGEVPYLLYSEETVENYLLRSKELIKWIESQIKRQ